MNTLASNRSNRVRGLLSRIRQSELAPGLALLVATAAALLWANSPWNHGYHQFWHTPLGIHWGTLQFERSLEWFVNDCLMVVFFFVVGIEIREEIHDGELAHWRRAALPTLAAIGGMIVPALFYISIARAPQIRSGWGVPMATDIAFAVGILTLLGSRVPPALRIVLLALAVIDDLGAILVIAIFYSSGVKFGWLVVAGIGLSLIVLLKSLRVRAKWIYAIPALLAWAGTYASGVHPTIAGVLLGLLTPVVPVPEPRKNNPNKQAPYVEVIMRTPAQSPAEYWLEHLQPWVDFGIMPIFALANAGVALGQIRLDKAALEIALGVGVGLVIGKPVGILLVSWLALKSRLATLPPNLTARHLWILGCVAGIGFTMSLFVAQLAFTSPAHLNAARMGIVVASAAAGLFAVLVARRLLAAGLIRKP